MRAVPIDSDSGEDTVEEKTPKPKKRKSTKDIDKPAKRPAIMDELATKIATFGKLIGRGTGWKAKARDLGSLVNIELDFDNNSRDQIIQILAHAHIK
jgi:hypothetical protein